ncbi:MAG: TIGR00725 family protein [Waddliaceae bacterium]
MHTIIGVMGSGEISEEEKTEAFELGKRIAENKWVLLTGGRDTGVMDAASRGAKSVKGITVGVVPDSDVRRLSEAVEIPIVTGMGGARNAINVLSCHVVIACRGRSLGTISEIALALKAGKPVILFNCISECIELFEKTGGDRVFSVRTPEEAILKTRELIST